MAQGGACADGWQCATGFCSFASGAACGTCAQPPGVGSACRANSDCAYGLVCTGASADALTCVAPVPAGAKCDATHPCEAPNQCAASRGAAQGTCRAGAKYGQSCETVSCDVTAGLICIGGLCDTFDVAGPGEPCGNRGGYTFCTSNACDIPTGQFEGTCRQFAEEGGACDDINGSNCRPGIPCIGGVCRVPDPTSCR